jgi:hypothetical protein
MPPNRVERKRLECWLDFFYDPVYGPNHEAGTSPKMTPTRKPQSFGTVATRKTCWLDRGSSLAAI